jgi:hypothetical protein
MYSIFASLYHTGFLDICRLQLASEACLLLVPLTARFVCKYAKVVNPAIKVIRTAGSADKIAILKSIGIDVAFNYKEPNVEAVLREHGPIDMCVFLKI